jgi:deazaflavin-dependent oxidoreductase (nitroreductase family)
MSDDTAAPTFNDFNTKIIEEFRANDGVVGGPFEGATLVLLTTTGARSGQPRVAPLASFEDGDRLFVIASKGGAPTHPDWFHNIKASAAVTVERGTETFRAEAVEVSQPERDQLYAKAVAVMPGFGEYQEKTDRIIPVVELRRSA